MIPLKDVIPSRTWPVVSIAILAITLLVFLGQLALGQADSAAFISRYGLVPADAGVIDVLTSMFIHGGFLHLAISALYLWIFAENVEDRLGHGRFAVFYLLCGAAAAVAQVLLAPQSRIPIVGASGAIAGVMGAYFVLYPSSRVLTLFPFPLALVEVPAVFFLGLWFVLQFLTGIGAFAPIGGGRGGSVFWTQLTGFLTGALFCLLLRRPERARVEWWAP